MRFWCLIRPILFNIFAAPGDLVVGAGRFEAFDSKVEIVANGENAMGKFRLRQNLGNFIIEGKVQCLNVDGNIAVAGGTITKAANHLYLEGTAFYQHINDNGDNEDDGSRTEFPGVAFNGTCPTPFPFEFQADRGNYTVMDR